MALGTSFSSRRLESSALRNFRNRTNYASFRELSAVKTLSTCVNLPCLAALPAATSCLTVADS